ncbi:hypothetical protein PUR61_29560 [Streptomyces sp. BE20]|uniref:hypothetical protein n=1 Tax=Streptomyces sp. BE20 TaxID=3002525 RepID=UPI002E79A969|nr:hypothetical protein [Streptomyces sp. BE20]MEE1826305.1 hypothetical protein [Streptomyces sp. BE20]
MHSPAGLPPNPLTPPHPLTPRLLVVLVGTAAAAVRSAVADLRLAAEENPTVAEMLAAVTAGTALIEDLVQRGPATPIWHPLSSSGRACGSPVWSC